MTSDDNPLAALEGAGFPVGSFTDEERAVFSGLGMHEIALLIDIKARLDAAAPEVQAHVTVAGAGLF
jgi:hypothetical protein